MLDRDLQIEGFIRWGDVLIDPAAMALVAVIQTPVFDGCVVGLLLCARQWRPRLEVVREVLGMGVER